MAFKVPPPNSKQPLVNKNNGDKGEGSHPWLSWFQQFFLGFLGLQDRVDTAETDITGIQAELDATQVGAGLGNDGTYTAPGGTTFLGGATSLSNADVLLDAQLGNALIVSNTSASATGGANEPYATHDGNDSPVPYEPDGFVIVNISGSNKKIPFFNL